MPAMTCDTYSANRLPFGTMQFFRSLFRLLLTSWCFVAHVRYCTCGQCAVYSVQRHRHASMAKSYKKDSSKEPTPLATERYYTVREIADLFRLDKRTVRSRFADVEGVIYWRTVAKTGKPYRQLRIPESVLVREHAKMKGLAS